MISPAHQAAAVIKEFVPHFQPKVGLILGSGLGAVAEAIEDADIISYRDITGFPQCTIAGHEGTLYLGHLKGVPIACLQGRAHFYEGYHHLNEEQKSATLMAPVRTLKLLGCDTMIATNSAGSLKPDVTPGDIVVIRDHINFQFNNPLIGENDEAFGPRFIGMENAYDSKLRLGLVETANKLQMKITEGVYIGVLGPSFETPAEINAFAKLGADVVGMSTIPEVITARHCGLRVAALSLITNMAAGMSEEQLSHEVTLAGAQAGVARLAQLILKFITDYFH